MTEFTPAPIPDGKRTIDGNTYMGDGKGGWRTIEGIKPQELLEDETVRKIMSHAIPLSAQVSRFKGHTFEDVGALEALLAQEYGAKLGGRKGNMTLYTVDRLFKVEVRVADRLDFGPELQAAKSLFDECLNEWSASAPAELRDIVTDAFNTDRQGQINRSHIFMLLRRQSEDERWQRGQDAIRDAMRVVGSAVHIYYWERASHDAPFQSVTINLAKA